MNTQQIFSFYYSNKHNQIAFDSSAELVKTFTTYWEMNIWSSYYCFQSWAVQTFSPGEMHPRENRDPIYLHSKKKERYAEHEKRLFSQMEIQRIKTEKCRFGGWERQKYKKANEKEISSMLFSWSILLFFVFSVSWCLFYPSSLDHKWLQKAVKTNLALLSLTKTNPSENLASFHYQSEISD